VATFLLKLGMSEDAFIKRKELVDLVTAYHVIPGTLRLHTNTGSIP
jgi:hypothetical protein